VRDEYEEQTSPAGLAPWQRPWPSTPGTMFPWARASRITSPRSSRSRRARRWNTSSTRRRGFCDSIVSCTAPSTTRPTTVFCRRRTARTVMRSTV